MVPYTKQIRAAKSSVFTEVCVCVEGDEEEERDKVSTPRKKKKKLIPIEYFSELENSGRKRT